MDEASVVAMAERVAARAASYPEAPSIPPSMELAAALAACEDRIGTITHHVVIGNLPEKALTDMRRQVDVTARSAAVELRQTLSEMDFILASVGLGREDRRGFASSGNGR